MTKFSPKPPFTPFVWLAIVSSVVTFTANSQTHGGVDNLRDSVRAYDVRINDLQHVLEGATVDWAWLRHSRAHSWIIGNPELRDSLFYALMAVDSSIQSEAGAEALVIATPSDDLIEVRFGNAIFKGLSLQNAIQRSHNKNLYEEIASSYRYARDIELRDPDYALETDHEPQLLENDRLLEYYTPLSLSGYDPPKVFRSTLSLSGFRFNVGPHWGGEYKIGNEEINFPYWTSGKMAFMATYRGIKLGFELPFTGGLNESDAFPPFIIRSRKLNGTRGIVGEFDFGPIGGKISFTRLTNDDIHALTDPEYFYYISDIAQAYFSFGVELTPSDFVRVKVGGGTHQVKEASLSESSDASTQVTTVAVNDYFSPYIKFEYLNNSIGEQFGVSIQYYDVTLVSMATLEVIKHLLGFELLYMWPLAADRPEWQNPEFLILTPRLYFSF